MSMITSTVIAVIGLTGIAAWIFNISFLQNLIPDSDLLKVMYFALICLLFVWDVLNRLNEGRNSHLAVEAELKEMNMELVKRVESRSAAVLRSEAKYRSLIEQASDAIYVLNFENNFIDVNARMCEMTGYTRDELLALDARRDGFNLALALTREPVRRADDYGRRVDTAMLTELLAKLPERPKQVFVCGSNPFVEAAADATIAAGVASSLIRTERYGG